MKGNYSMNTRVKRMIHTFVGCSMALSMYLPCTTVYATDNVDSLEQKTNQLSNELSAVNQELSTISSDLDFVIMKVESTAGAIETTKLDLADAQAKEIQQHNDMKLRIKYMYETGDVSFLDLLFSAENMTDLLNKADFIQNISSYDRKMLDELHNTKVEIENQQTLLEDEQSSLMDLQQQLNQKSNDLQTKAAATSDQLHNYSAQLERARAAAEAAARAAEAQKRAEEQARLQAAAAAQAQAQAQAGTQTQTPSAPEVPQPPVTPEAPQPPVTPEAPPVEEAPAAPAPSGGQSLGVFKITHYCPCSICCGEYANGITATGTTAQPNWTIAVDPSQIPLGSTVLIGGQSYHAEDTGGAIQGNKIDVYVGSHDEALSRGTYYTEVFLP